MPKNSEVVQLWHEFIYDLYRATASLLYFLQGMDSVRERELVPYNALRAVEQTYTACFAKVSYIGVPLSLSGPSFDANHILGREGEAEQMAFKGWVEQVYNCVWESKYRNKLMTYFEGKDVIPPEGDPLGDLRRIRNDLVHQAAIASAKETGKCEVLTWFQPGEKMILGIRHVLDFLNQMGLMTKYPGVLSQGPAASWGLFPGMEETLRNAPIPKLVSLRMSFDQQFPDGSTQHVASIVFENSIFLNLGIKYSADERALRERIKWINQACIDHDSNLRLCDGKIEDRRALYREAIDSLLNKEPKTLEFGVRSPAFRFRRD